MKINKRFVICFVLVAMMTCLVSVADYRVQAGTTVSVKPGEDETDIILKPTPTPVPTPTPTATPVPTVTPTVDPTPTHTVEPTDTVKPTETVDPTETVAATNTPEPTPSTTDSIIDLGNVNGDDKIDAKDALDVLKHAARLSELFEERLAAADVTGDGKVDATDALDILKYAAKIIDGFRK